MQPVIDIFPTHSRYEGSYIEVLHCMKGFGTYTYPDGSHYRGYFHNGQFQGHGYLQMAAPNNFKIEGLFESGHLVQIDSMTFGDGLRLEGHFDGEKLNCDKWRYCTADDRRFFAEVTGGIEPVGPNAYETCHRQARRIPKGSFDNEEGIYKPKTGFVTRTEKGVTKNRFVGCKKEEEWILKHCRQGFGDVEEAGASVELEDELCRGIIETNWMELGEDDKLSCIYEMPEKFYLEKDFTKNFQEDSISDEDCGIISDVDVSEVPVTPPTDTSSVSSCIAPSITFDMKEQIRTEPQGLGLPHDFNKFDENLYLA